MSTALTPSKRPSRITVPERCHPLAKVVFAEMQRQGITYDELEWRAGVLRSTFKAWRTDNRPGLETMEAALGALGWSLLPVPQFEQLPQEVRDGLDRLAELWADKNELLCSLLARVCRAPIEAEQPKQNVSFTIKPLRRPKVIEGQVALELENVA